MGWIDKLDDWLTTPPENKILFTDSLGNEIYKGDSYCNINDMILSEESLEDCSLYLEEQGETFTCACCEDEFGDDYDYKYYKINGECFCQGCVDSAMVDDF